MQENKLNIRLEREKLLTFLHKFRRPIDRDRKLQFSLIFGALATKMPRLLRRSCKRFYQTFAARIQVGDMAALGIRTFACLKDTCQRNTRGARGELGSRESLIDRTGCPTLPMTHEAFGQRFRRRCVIVR